MKVFILTSLANTPDIHPHTGKDFFPRTEGSTVKSGLKNTNEDIKGFLASLDWEEITEDVMESGAGIRVCRYFEAELPEEIEAVEAAWTMEEFVEQGGVNCRAVAGRHQVELLSKDLEPQPTRSVVMSIGPWDEEDTQGVYFWAPGRVLPPQGVVKYG